jgi:hypothetical protein
LAAESLLWQMLIPDFDKHKFRPFVCWLSPSKMLDMHLLGVERNGKKNIQSGITTRQIPACLSSLK